MCPTCNKPYGAFKNDESIKEYKISGMCQSCQDGIFGEDPAPLGLPTGKCPNCGNFCYEGNYLCSGKCTKEYMTYLNSN